MGFSGSPGIWSTVQQTPLSGRAIGDGTGGAGGGRGGSRTSSGGGGASTAGLFPGGAPSASGGMGGLPPVPPMPTGPQGNLNLTAQDNPHLLSLLGDASNYVSDLKHGTGEIEDTTGQKVRDAREGARRALGQSEVARGVASSTALPSFDAETLRAQDQAITGEGLRRQEMVGQGIGMAGNIASNVAADNLANRQLSLGAWNAANAQANNAFQNWFSLLQANRTSPAYSATAAPARPTLFGAAGGGGGGSRSSGGGGSTGGGGGSVGGGGFSGTSGTWMAY